jgi:hypothetical protein
MATAPSSPALSPLSRSFARASLRALHLDRGAGPTTIATPRRRRWIKSIAVDHDLLSR